MKKYLAAFVAAATLLTTVTVSASSTSAANAMTPIYKFYSSSMKDTLLTASAEEKDQLEWDYYRGVQTYEYYGIISYAESASTGNNTPVYRFWNPTTCDHFYTTNAAEKDQLQKDLDAGRDNYRYEGIAWYAPTYSGKPVYRLFDTVNFNHYYTSDVNERDRLQQGAGTTWRYEGIAWYWYE